MIICTLSDGEYNINIDHIHHRYTTHTIELLRKASCVAAIYHLSSSETKQRQSINVLYSTYKYRHIL